MGSKRDEGVQEGLGVWEGLGGLGRGLDGSGRGSLV